MSHIVSLSTGEEAKGGSLGLVKPQVRYEVDRILEIAPEVPLASMHMLTQEYVPVHTQDRTFDFMFAVHGILVPVSIN